MFFKNPCLSMHLFAFVLMVLIGTFLCKISLAYAETDVFNTGMPSDFCMTDDELKAYLLVTTSFSWGRGAGICFMRYGDLEPDFVRKAESYEAISKDELDRANTSAFRAFERSFGKEARSAYDNSMLAASSQSDSNVSKYGKKECKNYFHGIEAIYSSNENFNTAIDGMLFSRFSEVRGKIKKCVH